jgi:hypothetical protein
MDIMFGEVFGKTSKRGTQWEMGDTSKVNKLCGWWLEFCVFSIDGIKRCRSHQSRCLRSRSATACLPRLWVRIPPRTWMFVVNVVCCLCDELITRPGEFYGLWCVIMCNIFINCDCINLLLLCMFNFLFCYVCSVFCIMCIVCVNVCCTAATVCQPNCG